MYVTDEQLTQRITEALANIDGLREFLKRHERSVFDTCCSYTCPLAKYLFASGVMQNTDPLYTLGVGVTTVWVTSDGIREVITIQLSDQLVDFVDAVDEIDAALDDGADQYSTVSVSFTSVTGGVCSTLLEQVLRDE